jgi:hypothetical protein
MVGIPNKRDIANAIAHFLMSLTCPTDVVEVAASLAVNPIFYKE